MPQGGVTGIDVCVRVFLGRKTTRWTMLGDGDGRPGGLEVVRSMMGDRGERERGIKMLLDSQDIYLINQMKPR